ncbi:MAG TPA: AAA family ATPase, partial [Vicinamibacteria bacterium]|nr:AAA family ATPase [Vicinamibacteria bacterium]
IQGLTSFRDRVELDFEGLDLFAITGATGAGKSSLIDAMTLALFGQVPRVSDKYKQLISHGAERLSVLFDFRVGGETYRVARTIRASGSPAFRLERLTPAGAEPLADRDKDVCEQVERILGLDYDAFVRSVVLPQGQFDAFLKGKPEERRKILVSLLNLKVYEDMHGIVNRRSTEARREADFIARQLGHDFAGATPERLQELRRDLGEAEAACAREEEALGAVAQGVAAAREVREARREVQRLQEDARAESARAAAANSALARVTQEQVELERRRRQLQEGVQAAGFDEGRLLALSALLPRLEQLAALRPQLEKLEQRTAAERKALESQQRELRAAEATLPGLEAQAREAQERLDAARQERDGVQRRHAAHALRAHLSAGEACPVCEQVVRSVPAGRAPAVAAAEKAAKAAEAAARQAEARAQQARVALERLRGDVAGQDRHVRQLAGQAEEAQRSVADLRAALAAADVKVPADADLARLLAQLERERAALQKARGERDRLEAARRQAEADGTRIEAALAKARAQAEDALGRLERLQERQAAATAALEAVRKKLLARGRKEGWGALEAPLLGRDELDVLEERQSALQRELSFSSARAARLRGDCDRLEKDIARAAELGERKKALDQEACLALTLAQHLQANQFIA